jgi:hypothetical protein
MPSPRSDLNHTMDTESLRLRVLSELEQSGFVIKDGRPSPPAGEAKEVARLLHGTQRAALLEANAAFIWRHEDAVVSFVARGNEVSPSEILPVVRPVSSHLEEIIFKYVSLLWSVPVSQGYGRRNRFLVLDGHNGKLIGVFALGDPVINLGARDRFIGWSAEARHARLYNVLDAFVLGAVPPYRELLAGKLMALLTLSTEVQDFMAMKYAGTLTFGGSVKNPVPAMVTTTSALGRSSVYNRLTYDGELAFIPVGYTAGYGHFHFSDSLFQDLVTFNRELGLEVGSAYGQGANYRIRVLRTALSKLGLPPAALKHGIERQVFVAPVATNWRSFLLGEDSHIDQIRRPGTSLGRYWRSRWAVGRGERNPAFRAFDPQTLRLSRQLPDFDHQLALEVELG